jgi:cytochrome c-type biogenesis protein CcsB
MRQIWNYLTSLSAMAFLLLVLAFAMAIATFIETSYGTPAARVLVYNAWWFELIWLLLAINLVDNMWKFRQYRAKTFTMFMFHMSFLVIIIGAAITRYISFEGTMHIREGRTADYILSYNNYFYASSGNDVLEKSVEFSEITPKRLSGSLDVNGKNLKVKSVGYITNATRTPVPSDVGDPIVDFVLSGPGGQGMQSYILEKGYHLNFSGFSVGFEPPHPVSIHMFVSNDRLMMVSSDTITQMAMGAEEAAIINPGDTIELQRMFIYNFGNTRFLIRNFYEKAVYSAAKGTQQRTGENAIIVKISDGVNEKVLPVFGHPGYVPDTVTVEWQGELLQLAYGAKKLAIPFSLRLREFQLERYPGSDSPSSFASEVTLVDQERNVNRDLRIYMNNTLTYRGYKFFQSSYDQDEQGTILSVNHDFWGTWITYFGYLLLTLGMILSLINPNSHFQNLARRLKKLSVVKVAIIALLLAFSVDAWSQPGNAAQVPAINKQISSEFSRLWVHSPDGRIKPVGTLASEVVRKLSRKQTLYGKSSDEVILSMMVYPEMWQRLPILKISNKTLATTLGANGSFISLVDLFDAQGQYRIIDEVRAAYNKAPALRNRVEKEYIYLDEKVNISFMISRGDLLNLFPVGNPTEPWVSPGSRNMSFAGGDSLFVASGIEVFKQFVAENKVADALQVIGAITKFQEKYGGELLPTPTKNKAEIFYNQVNPFERTYPWYLGLGFLLLFVLFVNIFRQKTLVPWLRYSFYSLIGFLFATHTIGLIVRWYISGHAPWSNGYESVVYVAWASMLAGFIFGKKYPMVIGTAAFFTGISLFVAHLSWMNPEITPLVPVLKSYWLTIHVSIITASYGFIGLSAFIGVLVMILIIIRNLENGKKVTLIIDQITTISEMSATVGLYFLTLGTFFGAIWANESWGRYWGWDPKETWSLITMVVYSFIVHMRLIPSLKGVYNYNLAAIIGFLSVMMTYFGVNYYLSGLHSYGSGSSSGIHPSVPITLAVLAILMFFAMIKDNIYEKNIQNSGPKKKNLVKG